MSLPLLHQASNFTLQFPNLTKIRQALSFKPSNLITQQADQLSRFAADPPPRPAPVAPSVVLVSESVAAKAKKEEVPDPPAAKVGKAPFAPEVNAKKPVALTTPGLTSGTTYVVKVKIKGGTYGTLGSVVATGSGEGVLPVFRPTKPGIYIMALINQSNGSVTYIKIKAS